MELLWDGAWEPVGAYADRYSLLVDRAALPYRGAGLFRFRVLDGEGHTIRGFDLRHGSRMHLLVVRRRDLTNLRHLHPAMSLDGIWTAPLQPSEAGVYRAIADFSVSGVGQILGAEFAVPGSALAAPVPKPEPTVRVGGYEVSLEAPPPPAEAENQVEFRLRPEDGGAASLEKLSGAPAHLIHLIALREGDLQLSRGRLLGITGEGEGRVLTFELGLPEVGRHRLFLRFSDGDEVHTAAFTVEPGR